VLKKDLRGEGYSACNYRVLAANLAAKFLAARKINLYALSWFFHCLFKRIKKEKGVVCP